MKDGERKIKRVLKRFITLVSLMVVAFLIYYFISTYNTIRVYKIDGYTDNFNVIEGLAIFSKGKSYLRIGEITSDKNLSYDSFEIFYKDNNKEKIILESDDTNYTLLSSYGYNNNFSYNNLKKIENNTYIRIKYQDKEEVIKLNFQRDMVNNFLSPNSENDIFDDSNFKKNSDDAIQKFISYVNKNWKYNIDNNEYSYSDYQNGTKYELVFQVQGNCLLITEYKNNVTCIVEIYFNSNIMTYSEKINTAFKEIYSYDFSKKECLKGKCDDNTTNYYLENYYYKYTK